MDIDLDIATLESTASTYEATAKAFTDEKEQIKSLSLTAAYGWGGESYLAFVEECSYMLISVFASGIESINAAHKALEAATEKAKVLQARANAIGGTLSNADGTASSKLYYSSADASSVLDLLTYVDDDLISLQSSVFSAREAIVFLETTNCNLQTESLSMAVSGGRAKLSSVKSQMQQFNADLSNFGQDLITDTTSFNEPEGLVVGPGSLYADGVLDLAMIEFLMGVPAGMLTPSELAALANALETIMGEVFAAENTKEEKEKLQLLARFLECCYDDPVVGQQHGTPLGEVTSVALEFPLRPNFDALTNFIIGKAKKEGTEEQVTLANWLQSVQYNASPLVQFSREKDKDDAWVYDKPRIEVDINQGESFISTIIPNCDSGRTYRAHEGSIAVINTLDIASLRFASSVGGVSGQQLLSEAKQTNVFGKHPGEFLSPLDYLEYFLTGRETGGMEWFLLKHGAKLNVLNTLTAAEGVCYVFYIEEYEEGLIQDSSEYQQDLTGQLNDILVSEGLNVSLNADGSLGVYQY